MIRSAMGYERSLLSRRQWMQLSAAGALGVSLSSWLEPWVTAAMIGSPRRRSCILLWMSGGPTQMDTFDLKPDHANGGPFQEIATAVPGIKISEHLPRVAAWMKHMALIRSMCTRQEDHGLATFLMHTGYAQMGGIQYPPLGALVSKELGRADAVLPNFVSITPSLTFNTEAHGSGFLGPMYAPLRLGDSPAAQASLPVEELFRVPNLTPPEMSAARSQRRLALLQQADQDFATRYSGPASRNHQSAYERAIKLMRSEAGKAFALEEEPAKERDSYGCDQYHRRTVFGQGCLLARRLIEHGVPFVEVTLGDNAWDTHNNNFETVPRLCQILDPAWSSLMKDLHERGLLETTLIVWMGEFGRSPKITPNTGRDHFATAWSTVLAGGGIRGGQVVGRTTPDGMEVKERPVSAADLMATICLALGMNPKKLNVSNTGRPIPLADDPAQPLRELLA